MKRISKYFIRPVMWRHLIPIAVGLAQSALCRPALVASAPRPNVIVILADDLGYRDLGAYGSTDIPTPNIDSLARGGIRFTSGYVTAPVCSPSRAGLMTGRYQQRFGHETNPGTTLETNVVFGLPVTETTMGNRMKALGLATGWIGKSHLGGQAEHHPQQRGFDEFFGFIQSHHDYLNPGIPTTQADPIRRGTTPVPETNYLTTAFARECVDYLDRHAREPFFLYAPFNAIHFPLQSTPDLQARAAALSITNQSRRALAAVLLGLDDAVGAILTKLRQLNLETNTLIFFTSDNGGTVELGSRNAPLRGGKTEVYEGGIRVPFLMQWKGHLPTNTVVDAPVSTLDILPTAIAAVGGTVPSAWRLDGVNLLPYVMGQTIAVPHPRLFWRIETDGLSPGGEVKDGIRAVREGDWKLVKPGVNDTWELYNLAADIGESANLANARPDIVQQLVAAYDDWSAQLARPRWAVDDANYTTPEFVVEDVRIGTNGVSYLAPEFLPGGAQVAFEDAQNNLWHSEFDPVTGFLRSGHGQDQLVDTGLAPFDNAADGPEWGLSTNGPAIFYTKPGSFAHLQIWRARLSANAATTAQLTANRTNDSFGVHVSQEADNASVKIAFSIGSLANSAMFWADENTPTTVLAVPRHAGGFRNGRWLPDSADLVYSGNPIAPAVPTQIARYRTATGVPQILSDDAGDKTDVWGFLAPEFNGELCYVAVVDHRSIAIYRDLHDKPNGLFTRVATLTPPTNAPLRYIYSLEPLQGLRGFNGTSYFAFAAYENNNPQNPGDSEMWLVGLGPDDNHRFNRRVDEGAGSSLPAERRDPKTAIGEREVFYYYSRKSGTNDTQLRLAKTGLTCPDYPGTPTGFTSLRFSPSFNAGTNDTNGVFMGGTETMNLVAHQGRLYAGQSSRMNLPYPANTATAPATWSGAQVLVKDSPTSAWRVDDKLPQIFRAHLRVEALVDFTFTTLANGTPLPQPANLLIAGLSDIGSTGATLASARTRNDTTGDWEESHVTTTTEPANTISFGSHVDRASRVHQIFAGLSNGQIHRGSYSPLASGKLIWVTNAELSGVGAVSGFVEANGLLYAVCGLRQANSNAPVTGGLFLRRDTNATWELVYQWPHPVEVFSTPEENRLMRGLTVVPEPHGDGREVLLAARAWPGAIERIDPFQGHAVTVELDVRDFYARFWNDNRVRQASVTIAYNSFTAATNPVTGERIHLLGVWLQHPDTNSPSFNGSHFLIRHRGGTYEAADVENFGIGQTLRATRCIAVSPFAEDRGAIFYFGGYDTANDESRNTAWIMRGDWVAYPDLKITRPDPPDWQLTWPITETNWVLEASATLGPAANWQKVPGLSTRSLTDETQSVSSQEPNAFYRLHKP